MAKEKGSKLTDQQKLFCREYIVDYSGKQAAIRAGYSEHTAKFQASDLLTRPNLRAFIQKLLKGQNTRLEINADRVLRELGKVAFAELGPNWGLDEDGEEVRIEKEISWTDKIKVSDKNKALEILAKHLKLLRDQVEHMGKNGGPIQTEQKLKIEKMEDALRRIKSEEEGDNKSLGDNV